MSGQDFVNAARNAGPNATIRIAGPGGVRFGVLDDVYWIIYGVARPSMDGEG